MGSGASAASKSSKYPVQQPQVMPDVRELWLQEIFRVSPLHADDALEELPDVAKADREVVLTAVQRNGFALKFAAKCLKHDREFTLAAMRAHGQALKYAADPFRNDKEIVAAAVANAPGILSETWFPPSLKNDREFIKSATSLNPWVLQHAPEAFTADLSIVSVAISRDGRTLQHAAKNLRQSKDVVLAAVRQKGIALLHAGRVLKVDAEVALTAVENGFPVQHLSETLRENEEIAMAGVRRRPNSLQYVPETCSNYRQVVEEAVRRKPGTIKFAKVGLSQDHGLLTLASSVGDKAEGHDRMLVMSVQHGLAAEPTAFTALVHAKLKQNEVISTHFVICNPAGVCKAFCGPDDQFSSPSVACRGDCAMICKLASACNKNPQCILMGTEPTAHSCWRYSIRWYHRKAKDTNGCMLQVVERPVDDSCRLHWKLPALTAGQQIDESMAKDVGLESFRLEMPHLWSEDSDKDDLDRTIEALADQIESWAATSF